MRRLGSLPIRWRLALTSAALTFAILLLFAIATWAFTSRQLRSDFDNDLRATAGDLQEQIRVRADLFGRPRLQVRHERLSAAASGEAEIRIIGIDGDVVYPPDAAALGPPDGRVRDAAGYRVVSRPLFAGSLDLPVAYVQYGKPRHALNATIAKVQLLLFLGVLGGTGLALLAGLAVARRAMAPIAGLTGAAKEIARTRDPGRRLPEPVADDEVADLSRTLEQMLMALDAARGETEEMLARQREFVADASHELRTPLTSILANLELLEAELEGEEAEAAESALRSARRMRRLVAYLLLLARADAGRAALRRPTDVGAVLREAAAEVAPIAGSRDLSIDAPAGLVVDGSADDLHRLALNLLENAMVHTPPGADVQATLRADGPWIRLEVSDDGPGVPLELLEKVFERLARLPGAEAGAEAGGGSGLGLAIVRAVAEAHGGTVALDESAGGGARFVVWLPTSGERRPRAEPVAQTSTTTGSTIGRRLSRS